ncbi:hypothetical protein BKA64DRAFT_715481 [Cadophora sp. MPI-SDFR-AT-0126]|nr:hypothetical protein BKA64DRAFT_715481 [Leotiomycetes sp. MPI-SDFR-AT-0126]
MVKATASRWIDYSIANSSIQEDIDATVDSMPWDPHGPARPYSQGQYPVGRSATEEPRPWRAPAYIIAEPGEWEAGPGSLMDVDPPQDRVYRLKDEIAGQHGLRNEWAIGWLPKEGEAPEGSMCFAQAYL